MPFSNDFVEKTIKKKAVKPTGGEALDEIVDILSQCGATKAVKECGDVLKTLVDRDKPIKGITNTKIFSQTGVRSKDCPVCGSINLGTDNFCSTCGQRFSDGSGVYGKKH